MTEFRPRPRPTGQTPPHHRLHRLIRTLLHDLLTYGRPIPPCGVPDTDQRELA